MCCHHRINRTGELAEVEGIQKFSRNSWDHRLAVFASGLFLEWLSTSVLITSRFSQCLMGKRTCLQGVLSRSTHELRESTRSDRQTIQDVLVNSTG